MPVAFPGAEGFGADTVGGRGGTMYIVTNLNDAGSGSFREACEASSARIVVFAIGGTIETSSRIDITNPNITIAGQTAPGGGITLKSTFNANHAIMAIKTGEVIMRYVRLRRHSPGDPSNDRDTLQIGDAGGVDYVIVDHCSICWGIDENVEIWYGVDHLTFQWSIISEGLMSAGHSGGDHSMGMIVGGTTDRVSIHHNLFAHNDERSPRLKPDSPGGTLDVVNNVIYNPGDAGTFPTGWGASHSDSPNEINYVGNYLKAGADTIPTEYYISGGGSYYVKGNITPDRPVDVGSEIVGVVRPGDYGNVVGTPFSVEAVPTTSAAKAYDEVLADAGANKRLNADGSTTSNRDAVDDRIVSDVEDVTGSIIDDPSDVGGWPSLAAGTAYTDTDGDGMPDDWEIANGLDPNDLSDGPIIGPDGYSNVETFLNGLAEENGNGNGENAGASNPVVILGASSTPQRSLSENTEIDEFWEGYFQDIEKAQQS